jgi:membrane protein required for colicin V production
MTTEVWWQNAAGPVWLDTALKGLKPLLPEALLEFLP